MSDYKEDMVFKGSCSNCGLYQTHTQERCHMLGCITLHYYSEIKCECGEVILDKSGSGNLY